MDDGTSEKRPSGGARAVERKHRARDAQRDSDYQARAIRAFRKCRRKGKGAEAALDEAMAVLREAMRQASTDPGLPPEQAREQAARIASYVIKAADPKKLIDELGAELRTAEAELAAIEETSNAPQEPAGSSRGAPPAAQH
jgi:hypothetical protein